MAFELKMPQLGLTMEEGTLSKWIKHEGDTVKAGDVVAEITTDKLTNELTSEQDGVLLKIVAQEGDDVPAGVDRTARRGCPRCGARRCGGGCAAGSCRFRCRSARRRRQKVRHRHRRRPRRLCGRHPGGAAGR